MSTTFLGFAGELDTNRGYSDALWRDCPWDQWKNGRSGVGFGFEDDFIEKVTGRYTETDATTGTFELDDKIGGVALLDSASNTVGQGEQIQLANNGTGEFILPQANSNIWFEARCKLADIATGPEFFIGLSVIDSTLIASSANSSANHIGFEVLGALALGFHGEKAGARGSIAGVHTLVEDTYVKLGFKVTGVTKIEVFVNGILNASTLLTANIPVTEMTLSAVCQVGTTNEDAILHLDKWRVFQSLPL